MNAGIFQADPDNESEKLQPLITSIFERSIIPGDWTKRIIVANKCALYLQQLAKYMYYHQK